MLSCWLACVHQYMNLHLVSWKEHLSFHTCWLQLKLSRQVAVHLSTPLSMPPAQKPCTSPNQEYDKCVPQRPSTSEHGISNREAITSTIRTPHEKPSATERPMTETEQLIADQADLEAFARLPSSERRVTDRLKGVLAETAVTGVIRYPWPLLQPVVLQMMQEQLGKYEAEEHVEIGPARPMLGDSDSVPALVQRFSKLLDAFDSHPWTLQRLCEVLLEPQKQYKRLHKLALAIEKLLLVTGELCVSDQPGPPPALSQLTRVNEAPPAAPGAAAAGNATNRQGDSGGGLVAAALDIRQQPGQQAAAGSASSAARQPLFAAAAAEDAGGPAPMQVDAATPDQAAGPTAAAAAAASGDAVTANGGREGDGDTAMEAEPPAAASPAGTGQAPAAAAAADAEMATEEVPKVTDMSHTNAVGRTGPHAADAGVS